MLIIRYWGYENIDISTVNQIIYGNYRSHWSIWWLVGLFQFARPFKTINCFSVFSILKIRLPPWGICYLILEIEKYLTREISSKIQQGVRASSKRHWIKKLTTLWQNKRFKTYNFDLMALSIWSNYPDNIQLVSGYFL